MVEDVLRCAAFLMAGAAFARWRLCKSDFEAIRGNPVKLTAYLTPFQSVDIFARVNGYLESISVEPGSGFEKGELISSNHCPRTTGPIDGSPDFAF